MKNVDFSNVLFSVFSPETILYPVKNTINPITLSMKDIIKKDDKNKVKLIRSKSALNLNRNDLIPKKLYRKYIKDISYKKGTNSLNIKYEENNINNFDYLRNIKLYPSKESKTMKNINNQRSNSPFDNSLLKDFIIIKPKNSKNNNYYKIINNKPVKTVEEPYKKYLYEKNKIEKAKKIKEIENKYILESKRQKQLKFENDIRTKYQGLDFSKQRKRESFIERVLKSKMYKKKEEKKLDNSEFDKFDIKFFLQKLNYEIKEKKYMFLENTNKFIPTVKYNAFKERFRIFNWHLKNNPNYSTLINYISNK